MIFKRFPRRVKMLMSLMLLQGLPGCVTQSKIKGNITEKDVSAVFLSEDQLLRSSHKDIPETNFFVNFGQASSLDVCGFSEPVCLDSVPVKDGMIKVPPYHPDILYFGRVDCSNKEAPFFSFPGVTIRATFTGTWLDVFFRDWAEPRNETTINYYTVKIDDNPAFVLELDKNQEVYTLARDLLPGIHTVELFKRTESSHGEHLNVGRNDFLGFGIDAGAKLLPSTILPNRIEFIGDSITCGYGNEISTHDPDNHSFTTDKSNAQMAWGAIAANWLNAEYMAVCYSGRGLVRNWADYEGDTLPQMYLKTLPDDKGAAPWDTSVWIPDVLVINLGTNDFSEGLDSKEQVKALISDFTMEYENFLDKLRGYYPKAHIILAAGPMLNDSFPKGVAAKSTVSKILGDIVSTLREKGDKRVHLLLLEPQTAPYGQDWHPTVATHDKMAQSLVKLVEEIYSN